MKRLLFIAALVLIAATAFAQNAPAAPAIGQPGSLVEVYGIIDTGLRLSTNADAAGDSSFSFS
ncbi:MAG: porin, partial [Spirochaetia bacterium]